LDDLEKYEEEINGSQSVFGTTAKQMTQRISESLGKALKNIHAISVENKLPIIKD
jgi:hypothetical protein